MNQTVQTLSEGVYAAALYTLEKWEARKTSPKSAKAHSHDVTTLRKELSWVNPRDPKDQTKAENNSKAV